MKVPASKFERTFGCANSGEGYGIVAKPINEAAIIGQNVDKSRIVPDDKVEFKYLHEQKSPITISSK